MSERTAAAVVVNWPALQAMLPEHGSRLRGLLADAACRGLHIVYVEPGIGSSRTNATCRRIGDGTAPGQAWLTPGGTAPHHILGLLRSFGIGPGLVAGIGLDASRWPGLAACLPSDDLLCFLDVQLRRRRTGRVPAIDEDPRWLIDVRDSAGPSRRSAEALLTIGAGGLATRGAFEESGPDSDPLTLLAGVYHGHGEDEALLAAPEWTVLEIESPPARSRQVLDLRTGVLMREELTGRGQPLRTMRLASVSRPGVVGMAAEASRRRLPHSPPLTPPVERTGRDTWRAEVHSDHGGAIVALAAQRARMDGGVRTVERVCAYAGSDRSRPDVDRLAESLSRAEEAGFDGLLREQRQAWAARWSAVNVAIPDDPAAELAARFALFQLWTNANRHDELAVGARGISGNGYRGHVFWDADVFVAPAMATIDPEAASAMLRYRFNRLAAARRRARSTGRQGTRFPWESASTGDDVTPTIGRLGSDLVPIHTGTREEHITADVAWSALTCSRWIGAGAVLRRRAVKLLVETARYWTSRIRVAADGTGHIDAVIGPDEYHDRVDDNAFTNIMARWNLRQAARAVGLAGKAGAESEDWLRLAGCLADGYHAATGLYEQFDGYFDLEPLQVADFATPPVAMDLLLGTDRVQRSQLIKQPDVLMAFHMVPDELEPGTLAANLDFYDPRTAHGSSLSPAVTAALLARAGRADAALAMLRRALSLDLDDLHGLTAGGLHLANLGAVWQALLTGFAGVSVDADRIVVKPCLPAAWPRLRLGFRMLGATLRLAIEDGVVRIEADRPLRLALGPRPAVEATCWHASTEEAIAS